MATLSAPPLQSANPNPSPYLLTDAVSGPEFTPESPASEPEPEPQSPPSQATSPLPPTEASSLLHLSFNQNCSFFATGTDRGFRVFSCDPFSEVYRRDFDCGGFGIVEMLFQCNIHALVGGGHCPQYPPNKVMIWDDNVSRCIGELCFRSKIRSVLLQQDRIVIILEQKIYVYELSSLKILNQIETVPNPKGLCAVSQQQGSMLLVCPGAQKGQVRVENCGTRRMKYIMAHNSSIACLALSSDGRLLATASSKGTLVRIFSTADCTLLQEVRRGADRAEIHSLAYSENMQWLAVSSDKGTVHVFRLKVDLGLTANDKPRPAPYLSVHAASSLSFIKGVLPKYFSSEWSVAQYRLREGFQYLVAFGHQKNTLIILGMDGSFYRCEYDPVGGGEMKLLECYNFLKPDDASS